MISVQKENEEMRLIDADHLRKWIIANGNGWHFKTVEDILDQIDREDTYFEDADIVDAEPIRHGHWNILTPQDDDGGWVAISCSNCNFVTPYASSRKEIEENGFVYHYCMYCGAKMDEVEE